MADQGAREVAEVIAALRQYGIDQSTINRAAALLREQADTIERHDAETMALHDRIAHLEGDLRAAHGLPACGESCCRLPIEDERERLEAELGKSVVALAESRAEVAKLRAVVEAARTHVRRGHSTTLDAALSALDEAEVRRG